VRAPQSRLFLYDTVDVVHGHQQLSLFNTHYDERCFLPIHVEGQRRNRRPTTHALGAPARLFACHPPPSRIS
jgi:hypothetical protein